MINLFENLDVASTDFLRSQLFAGLNIPSVVIHDDGFLPKEVDSPIKFYCKVTDKNTPLYFDKVKIPKFLHDVLPICSIVSLLRRRKVKFSIFIKRKLILSLLQRIIIG